jgi:hypothetical protein
MSFSPVEDVRKCILKCLMVFGRYPGHIRITKKFKLWLEAELRLRGYVNEFEFGQNSLMFGIPIVIAKFDDPADVSWASPPLALLEPPPLTDDPKSE